VCRLHTVAARQAALVSDEKRIRRAHARDDALYKLTTFTFTFIDDDSDDDFIDF